MVRYIKIQATKDDFTKLCDTQISVLDKNQKIEVYTYRQIIELKNQKQKELRGFWVKFFQNKTLKDLETTINDYKNIIKQNNDFIEKQIFETNYLKEIKKHLNDIDNIDGNINYIIQITLIKINRYLMSLIYLQQLKTKVENISDENVPLMIGEVASFAQNMKIIDETCEEEFEKIYLKIFEKNPSSFNEEWLQKNIKTIMIIFFVLTYTTINNLVYSELNKLQKQKSEKDTQEKNQKPENKEIELSTDKDFVNPKRKGFFNETFYKKLILRNSEQEKSIKQDQEINQQYNDVD